MLECKAKKIVEEMNEVKTCLAKLLAENIDLDCLDEEELRAIEVMSKCYKLMSSSMEYMVEQAIMMDRMNEKMDKVLYLIEKKE